MKTTIVPAQVISVEDIIAANLNLTQVVLLISPIFMSALVFLGLPPFMHIRVYKIILLLILSLPPLLLAVRINGIIVLRWVVLVAEFNFRPDYYLYSVKNHHNCYCQQTDYLNDQSPETVNSVNRQKIPKYRLSIDERIVIDNLIKQKSIHYYTDGKGNLNASIQ